MGLDLSTDIKSAATKVKQALFSPIVNPLGATKVVVPTIFVWEDKKNGEVIGAFRLENQLYGISFPYEMDRSRREMDKKHLKVRLRDTLDLLIHHGRQVMDSKGNVDPYKVKQVEADRYFMDPFWKRRVNAFRKVCRIKEITKDEALKLHLID